MGSQFVDGGPSWGSVFNNVIGGIEGAPGKALDNIAKAEQIKNLRLAREREAEQYGLTKNLIGTVDATVPAAQAKPTTTIGPFTGDINDPGVIQGLPTATFVDPRMQAAAESRRASAVAGTKATLFKDPSVWAPQLAQAEVASTGVPERADERARIQFATTGRFPTAEETKTPNAQNFTVVNADGSGTGQLFASLDGGRTALGGAKVTLEPGQRVAETGPAPQQPGNPLENEAKARERLNVLRTQIGPDGPTPEQRLQVEQLVDVAYKPRRVLEQDPNNADLKVYRYVQENPIPAWVTAMMGVPQGAAAPAAAAASAAAVAPTTIASQAITARDISDPAKLDAPLRPAPAAAAAAVPPVVDPNAPRTVEHLAGSADALRKEYAAQPEIKSYANAVQTWNAVVESAYTGNKANDLVIVYNFVKMLDEMTGVRDPEVRMVGQTGSWTEQFNTMVGQATGKGLDANMRANIIKTMQQTMGQFESAAKNKEAFFREQAANNRLAPNAVIPPLQPPMPFDEARARALRDSEPPAPAGGRQQPSQRAAPPPRPNY